MSNAVAIIPCFNAGGRVRPVVEAVLRQVPSLIVVDDGSTDGSPATLEGLPLRMVRLPQNRGKGHALLAGLRAALEEVAVQRFILLDADGQHDPAEIPGLLTAAEAQDADLLIGARVFNGQAVPWRSRFGNTVTVSVTALLLGRRLPLGQILERLFTLRHDSRRVPRNRVSG